MEKLMYLVWLDPETTRQEVGGVLLKKAAPALLELEPRGLSMDLWDEGSDIRAPVPLPAGEAQMHGVVSVWVDTVEDRGSVEAVLSGVAERFCGFSVVESLYRDYGDSRWSTERDWADGVRSPGVLTVALLQQHPGQTFDEWMTRWHSRISPITEAIQPRCRYVRNAVFRSLSDGAPPLRGIVEEAWPSLEDVTDPMRFFCAEGDPARMQANITQMIEEISAFVEMDTFRSFTMSEWILKS
jgi:hypothetical protein